MWLNKNLGFILGSIVFGLLMAVAILMLTPDRAAHISATSGQNLSSEKVSLQFAAPANNQDRRQASYALAVELASPAVVNVYTSKFTSLQQKNPLLHDPLFRRFFGQPDKPQPQQRSSSLGSGVIISPQGFILTNHHVIAGADEIRIALKDGRSAIANVVGSDPDTDLAVLHIGLNDLPQIVITALDDLHIGDVVLAIGNPFGVGQTVTQGIVSATGRNRLGINTFENFIQTDAAINPGNSGGALINSLGHLVGINTAIFSQSGGSQGIGFAIPMSIASDILQQLILNGSVIRGWLGIEARDLNATLLQRMGLPNISGILIAGVLLDGPAWKAGLQPGDIVTEIADIRVFDAKHAIEVISAIKPQTEFDLTIIRSGSIKVLQATAAQRPNFTR